MNTTTANHRANTIAYAWVTLAYWGLTLTDGALRMLVLLHFHKLGFSPLNLAFLFLLYEAMGVVTNLFGGYAAARFGLKATLHAGLLLQVVALAMLSFVNPNWALPWSVAFVMASQGLSGIAKDLTKMSSKSAVKVLVPANASQAAADSALFRWVALLTGSKNTVKGIGFFVGAALLQAMGFQPALWAMAMGLLCLWLTVATSLKQGLGPAKNKPKFNQLFAKSKAINQLAFARTFLFGARDVWFVVALPVFLYESGWSFPGVGAFMAAWVIGYGIVQASAPKLFGKKDAHNATHSARHWGLLLAATPACIALALLALPTAYALPGVLIGLGVFGVVFAINASVHSYLILALTEEDAVALNVGFYYMANAIGRLLGTLLSGVVFWLAGLPGCLWVSAAMVAVAALALRPSPQTPQHA